MARVHVVDRKNDRSPLTVVGWFDSDEAEVFNQAGTPPVERSRSLFSSGEYQVVLQRLLRTGDGRWVLGYEYGGSRGVEYRFVSDEAASAWLQGNGQTEVAQTLLDESERGPGRPEIGGRVQVRLGDLLADVDNFAQREGLNRAEAVRQLVATALNRDYRAVTAGREKARH